MASAAGRGPPLPDGPCVLQEGCCPLFLCAGHGHHPRQDAPPQSCVPPINVTDGLIPDSFCARRNFFLRRRNETSVIRSSSVRFHRQRLVSVASHHSAYV